MANKGQYVFDGFVARGFTPVQAAALAGNFQQESGFNPNAYNKNEDAFGGLQWRLNRKSGLENYAKATGRSAGDLDAQMDWVVQEMLGPESKNAASFLGAQDVAGANAALKRFIRYGDNSQGTRLQNALAFAVETAQPAAVQAITSATNGGGNSLMADNSGSGGFVNPAFGNNPLVFSPTPADATPQPAAPVVPPSQTAPLGQQQVAPAPSEPSDDDILKLFLPQASTEAAPALPTPSPAPQGQTSDDDILRQWLPEAKEAPAAPGAPKYDGTDPHNDFLDLPIPGTTPAPQAASQPDLSMLAHNPLDPAGAVSGLFSPSNADPNYEPSFVPFLDPINAAASKFVEQVPVVGPVLANAGNQFDASLNNLLTGQNQTPADRAAINAADQQQYPNAATAGAIAGTVAPFVAAGGIPGAGRLLGMTGSVPSRIGMGAVSGGLISGADTLARGGSVEDAKNNALLGGAIGAAIPSAGAGFNKLLAPAVGPKVAELAQLARDKYGIPIGPGQISENPTIRVADSVVNKIPFSGGTASRETQQAAFNKAVANTFGEKAEAITPDVMANASKRIGQMFDSVAARTPVIKADPAFDQSMLDIMTNAEQVLPPQELKPLMLQFDNIMGKFYKGGNQIDGDTYQALTRKGTPLDLATKSKDPNVRHFAGQLRNALDDVLQRSAPPDALKDLTTARSQWKAMKTIEDLAEKAPTGDISPSLLMGAVRGSYGDMAYGGGGDLAELARIGQQFLKSPPSSGTAERLMVMQGLAKTAGAAGGIGGLLLNPGLAVPAALSAAGAVAGGRAAGAVLRSKTLANALIDNGLKPVQQAGNALLAPAAGSLLVEDATSRGKQIPQLVIHPYPWMVEGQ